jgi:hypothetical protein
VGLRTRTKFTIYSAIIFLTSGIYFFLAYKGFSSQSVDIKTLDKFTGPVSERGVADRKSSKGTSRVFYLTINGLSETLGIYRMEKDYAGLIDEIQPGDTLTVYYLSKATDENINIDLVQIERRGQIIVDQNEYKKKESALIYIGLIGGLFSVGLSIWYYNKYVGQRG